MADKATNGRRRKHVKALSLARETARAAQKNAEAERDKSKMALEEVSEAKRRLEVLLSDSSAREKRMVELKKEVNTLLQQLSETPKYEAPKQVEKLISANLLLEA